MVELNDKSGSQAPSKVGVRLSRKINIGNYETIDIDLWVEDTVREGENVPQAFDRVYKFVEKKLNNKIQENEAEGGY